MEGLTALSLALNVIQLVDFGHKILSKANELRKSFDGALEDNRFYELIIKDLEQLLDRIERSSAPKSWPNFRKFRDDSLGLAKDFLDALEELKVKEDTSRWKTLRKALKAVRSKDKINDWKAKLDLLKDEFHLHIEVELL